LAIRYLVRARVATVVVEVAVLGIRAIGVVGPQTVNRPRVVAYTYIAVVQR